VTPEWQSRLDHCQLAKIAVCLASLKHGVFWLRRLAAFGGEQAAIEGWQIKRDGNGGASWKSLGSSDD
jgi:hypothetical protein